jgi:hypothetical protein
MLGRSDQVVGEYIAGALEPMFDRLGVDYTTSMFTPPATEEALTAEVYRCGLNLVMTFTYSDGWGVTQGDRRIRRQARKAAKVVRAGLHEDYGRDAISHMAQGFARETAALWRRVVTDAGARAELVRNAERSEGLGELAGDYWPVRDEFEVLPSMANTAEHRFFKLDNPDAMIDVRATAGRTQAACEAAALALGWRFEEFDSLVIRPVMALNLELGLMILTDWNLELEQWRNLLSDEPVEYAAVMQMLQERQQA